MVEYLQFFLPKTHLHKIVVVLAAGSEYHAVLNEEAMNGGGVITMRPHNFYRILIERVRFE